jgi:hypothetical protein
MLDGFEPRIDRDEENRPTRVWLSAQSGAGLPLLWSQQLAFAPANLRSHLLHSTLFQSPAADRSGCAGGPLPAADVNGTAARQLYCLTVAQLIYPKTCPARGRVNLYTINGFNRLQLIEAAAQAARFRRQT